MACTNCRVNGNGGPSAPTRRGLLIPLAATAAALAIAFTSCSFEKRQERAAGQPTMNELMHRRADEQQRQSAEHKRKFEAALAMTDAEVAALEARLRLEATD